MDYAWSLTPQQFSKQDGTVIIIDKKKKAEVMVPIDVAREVIRVGRISAHAQVCKLNDHQIVNHRSLMKREEEKKTWTDQQLVYINQLHLTTVMLLTGKIRLVEKDGDKEVVDRRRQAGRADLHRRAGRQGQGCDHRLRGEWPELQGQRRPGSGR